MQDFKFPFAQDKSTNKSSATLFFAYISFWQTFILVICLAYDQLLYGVLSSFALYIISIFMYRQRGIDKLKLGRNGIEISNDNKSNDNEDEDGNELPDLKKANKTDKKVDDIPEGGFNAKNNS